ncbi:MAG: mechanosensitive ion channel family protein [Gemmatimonadetes bacterium]|jgi:small conductance mechanosensitive channel|nr:mechanosensitive ion channel family protein [Gemmatimonadota bacterium]
MDISHYADLILAWAVVRLPQLLAALAITLATFYGSIWVRRTISRTARRLGGDEILWSYLGSVCRWLIMAVGMTTAMKQAGVPVDALLTTFGISGVIIGLGARTSIANYFAGIMMLGARPFKRGDLIEFGPPPQIGRVTEVKMTYTGLVTLENVRVIVPNSVMWRNKITNFSQLETRAIRVPISIPYDVDIDWVSDIALGSLQSHPAVLNDPPPTFTLSDVTADRVKALLVAWSQVETMNVFGDVVIAMRKEFETADLDVIVPAQDIDLKKEE